MKKLLTSFLLGLTLLFTFTPYLSSIRAQDMWSHEWYAETNPFDWYNKVYNKNLSPSSEIFGERYTAAQVQWVAYGVFSMILNLVPGNPQLATCIIGGIDVNSCVETVATAMDAFLQNIGITLSMNKVPSNQSLASTVLGTLENNPISGVAYTKQLVNKFSPVSTVKAQGFGFTAANSILPLWTAVRNISYGLLIVAAIVLAFMVMFRVKLSPQVVIGVQSAIPKLVIALILITFSYAIAGFLIDIMYVVIGLFALLVSADGGNLTQSRATDLFSDFTTDYSIIGLLYVYWYHFFARAFIAIFASGGNWFVGILVFFFSILVILAIILWSFKIFFETVKNFVMVIMTIVTGPLEILVGTVMPGMGFGKWVKRLVSYLAFYPILIVLGFLSFFFLYQGGELGADPIKTKGVPFDITKNMISGNTWNPPWSVGTQGGSDGGNVLIWVIVSFAIFSQIPKVSKLIQSLMSGRPFEFESGIGEATGAAISGAKLAAGMRVSSTENADEELRRQGKKVPVDYLNMILKNALRRGS